MSEKATAVLDKLVKILADNPRWSKNYVSALRLVDSLKDASDVAFLCIQDDLYVWNTSKTARIPFFLLSDPKMDKIEAYTRILVFKSRMYFDDIAVPFFQYCQIDAKTFCLMLHRSYLLIHHRGCGDFIRKSFYDFLSNISPAQIDEKLAPFVRQMLDYVRGEFPILEKLIRQGAFYKKSNDEASRSRYSARASS